MKAVMENQTEAEASWGSSFAELNSSWTTFPGWGICKYKCKRTKGSIDKPWDTKRLQDTSGVEIIKIKIKLVLYLHLQSIS